ncbi:hypothetical protein BK129_15680 [Paenibacillus amylolyticus]|uniref:DUF6809 family protein n=1 Tax=Paenibacillus amylolyticus TaxID=1451 RepID=UPI00096F366A|nr:DUF6809 family protein [Paenibacillus amylolyticus]OMF05419.1 hypothetical protein BK129_15680 [Paenibacillus amylolyticus]
MGNIIEELYYGNLRPEENIVPKDSEYRSIHKEITAYIEKFQSKLSEDDFIQLEVLFDMDQVHSIHSKEAFASGFKIGTLIMIESGYSS